MKLRASKLLIFAVLITLALIAALTVPSEQSHYAKLNSVYPRFNGLLFTDAVKDAEQSNSTKRHNVHLSYWNYGVASAVTSYPLYVPCLTGVRDTCLSFGIFGFVFVSGHNDIAPPSESSSLLGTYEASFDLNSPFAKGLVPDIYLAKINNDTRFYFSVTFSDQDTNEAKEAERQIEGLKFQVESLERAVEKLPQAERNISETKLDDLRNKLRIARLKKAEVQNARYVGYSSECIYSSKDPKGEAKLRDDYDHAREAYEISQRSNSPDKEERLARAKEAYDRLGGIPPFQDSAHGEGGWRLEDRKVYCDLRITQTSAGSRLSPIITCRLPALEQVRIVLRIERNGDLVVESVAPVKDGPPVGLNFTKQ